MEKVFKRLDATHGRLMDMIMPVDDERFARRPAENSWSIAEVVHHLCMVEERVLAALEQSLNEPPPRIGLLQRLMPIKWLVGSRVKRVKAPEAVEPLNPPAKEEVIANYDRVRVATKEFASAHGRARLEQVAMKHPFLGTFNGVSAIEFVGHHELRHYKQIKETLKKIGG